MDTYTLVENRIDDGRKLISLLFQKGFPLTAVWWAKTTNNGENWYLYVASVAVNQKGATAAYRDVYGVLSTISGVSISVSDVRLVGIDDPIAQDILKLQEPYFLGKRVVRERHVDLGSILVDEVYIYPLGPSPAELTALGQASPEIPTDLDQRVGPGEYIEIPYLKPANEPSENAPPVPSVLRLKRKEVRTFEVLTNLQVIEGRRFSTYAKISSVEDGVIGVDYRIEEIK